jgi:hypothetical protein
VVVVVVVLELLVLMELVLVAGMAETEFNGLLPLELITLVVVVVTHI